MITFVDIGSICILKSSVFWDLTPWSPLQVKGRFGGTATSASYVLHAALLHGLFVDPEEGGDIFLRNAR
jgi:hypothetical protein